MPSPVIIFKIVFIAFFIGCPGMLPAFSFEADYLPGRLIVKLQAGNGNTEFMDSGEFQSAGSAALQGLKTAMEAFDATSMTPVFGSNTSSIVQELKQSRVQVSDHANQFAGSLQRTFMITYRSGEDPKQVSAEIENLEGVVYAEPWYTYETAELNVTKLAPENRQVLSSMQAPEENKFFPNDPLIGRKGHDFFDYLNIFRAWGVNKGSSDVVIAIVDTGVYYDHPDLKDNLWHNNRPGLANEFFEDFEILNDTIGWNFWESGDIYKGEKPEQNADPVGNYSRHGTGVAGVAAAVTDNGEGIAGVGFRSQFMPVKVGGTKEYPSRMPYAIHGIIYAAIYGADVINCSFTGTGNSAFAADAIAFAQEMGSVVVAGIGNDGISTTRAYPALFDDVVSVGALTDDLDDRVVSFSNYSYKVDVFAVGHNVMSTIFEYDESENSWTPGYEASSGTSFSTPIVSGLAALLKAEYPDWPPQRIASQIRGTARSIYHANLEPKYEDKLGHGVIDAYAAMTKSVPVISFDDYVFQSEEGRIIDPGESGTLTVDGVHFGKQSPEVVFRLESMQPDITLHTQQIAVSDLEPGETFSIQYSLSIDEDYPLDVVPVFRLNWSVEGAQGDESYEGTYMIEYEELIYGHMTEGEPMISIGDYVFQNEQGRQLNPGESGTLTVKGVHFGRQSPELNFRLESMQPGITLHTKQKTVSDLESGEAFSIDYSLSIDDDYPLDVVPVFRLAWSAGDTEGDEAYRSTYILEYEELLYGNLKNNILTMSIPSDGTLGFMNPEDQSVGLGFIPGTFDNILSEAGFMISGYRNGEHVMINQVRDSTAVTRDFQPVQNFRIHDDHDFLNAKVGSARFQSVNHPVAQELDIVLEAITPVGRPGSRPVLFLNYSITNTSEHVYRDLHFGIFNRWKIREEGTHRVRLSDEENLVYVSHESGPPVAGIATRGELSGALAIDNQSTMTLDRAESRSDSLKFGILYREDDELLDGFTDEEKHLALTSGLQHASLDAEDISMVVGAGPYTLYPDTRVAIGFIYAWEHSTQRLQNEISTALERDFHRHDEPGDYAKTGKVADELTLYANYPNPFNEGTNIRFDLEESMHVELAVYDLLGRRVAMLVNEEREKGPHFVHFDGSGLASGMYVAILRTGGDIKSERMMLVK